jgi:hypothetical protein
MRTISFTAVLGENKRLTSAEFYISVMNKGITQPYDAGEFTGNDFSITRDDIDPEAYYLVVVKPLTIDNKSISNGIIRLMSVFKGSDGKVGYGSQATIATMFAFARAMSIEGSIITLKYDLKLLKVCYGMRNNITNVDGTVSDVLLNSPNAGETNAQMMLGFFASTLYLSMTDQYSYDNFVRMAAGGKPCDSYMKAMQYLIFAPFTNVHEMYAFFTNSAARSYAFPPVLSPEPNQYTMALKFHDTGSTNFLFAGAAFTVFDSNDRAWITNNFRAGTVNSGTHCIVLESDGKPASFSPLTGGGILGPGFGVAVNNNGTEISIGNFGWGPTLYNPEFGSTSLFKNTGEAISPPGGFTPFLSRVQGLAYDSKGNLWVTSVGTQEPFAPVIPGTPPGPYIFPNADSGIVVYPNGRPDKAVHFQDFIGGRSPFYRTFDVCFDQNDYAYVTNIGDKKEQIKSSVYKFKLENNAIKYVAHWESEYVDSDGDKGYESFRQVAVNSQGLVFICGMESNRIIQISNNLDRNSVKYISQNIIAPWGVTFDAEDTMFVANFGEEPATGSPDCNTYDMETRFGVTVVRTSDNGLGNFMTLPSGGDEVLLANGFPLYGGLEKCPGVPLKCYQPLMRLTATSIDRAGNLWAANNWKPARAVDVASNPGGDGVVVFLGVAELPERKY